MLECEGMGFTTRKNTAMVKFFVWKERQQRRRGENSPIMELLLSKHVVHKVDISSQKQDNES